MFKDRKKIKTINSVSPSGEAVLPSAQYNKDDNVIVRLVGNSPKKQHHRYH